MILQLILLVIGLALIVFGADFLVDGASGIARKAGISEFVIGLTIVGFGTSCPELVVSLTGAIQGNADISVGNVVGSNIFNTLLILGLTALLVPIGITEENRKRDIPITLGVTILFVLFGMSHTLLGIGEKDEIGRLEGVVFLLIFSIYMYYCFRNGRMVEGSDSRQDASPAFIDKLLSNTIWATAFVAAGLAALIFGGRLFVGSATSIAKGLGVSDKFIAITVLAAGTSLPELATSVVAAIKGKGQLALGNILGSNVFNILLILGLSALVTPLSMAGMDHMDAATLLFSALVLLICAFTINKNKIDRIEGAFMLAVFAAYYTNLFLMI